MKKLSILCLTILLLFTTSICVMADEAASAEQYHLIIDGIPYDFSESTTKPLIRNDRIYVPLRVIMEALDCEVQWLEATRQIYIVSEGREFAFQVTNDSYSEDGVQIIINGVVLEQNDEIGRAFINEFGSTMLPLRSVSTGLGCEVLWQNSVVIINSRTEKVDSRAEETTPPPTVSTMETQYDLTILGESVATAAQINAFLDEMEPLLRAKAEANGTIYYEMPQGIAEIYLNLGEKYGIRGDVALAQALKETGYFQYGGSVQPWQNNFCGLGATGVAYTAEDEIKGVDNSKVYIIPGMHGLIFSDVATGAEAHIQHLYSYVTTAELPAGCELVDPRFRHGYRGIGVKWTDLNGRWAVPGNGYGESIIDDYWMKMVSK